MTQWIADTDRASNPMIVTFIQAADLDTQLKAIRTLGLRNDPFVEDIIHSLYAGYARHKEELLLAWLLHHVFPAAEEPDRLARRISINREGVDLLVTALHRFQDPLLKAEIMRLIPFTKQPIHHSFLLKEGKRLEQTLKRQEGQLTVRQQRLVLQFLKAADQAGNPAFMETCLSIYELTRQVQIARLARRVIGKLARPAEMR